MASSFVKKTVEEIFCSASIAIIPTEVNDRQVQPTSAIVKLSQSEYSSSAYFRDATSKRAKVAVPLIITFDNEFERKKILKSGAVQPAPVVDKKKESEEVSVKDETDLWGAELDDIGETQGDELESHGKVEIKFECVCQDDAQNVSLKGEKTDTGGTVIEGVKILSTSLVDSQTQVGIRFDVEIAVRSVPASIRDMKKDSASEITRRSNKLEADLQKRSEAVISNALLGIRAALICRSGGDEPATYLSSPRSAPRSPRMGEDKIQNGPSPDHDLQLGLQALDMGIGIVSPYSMQDGLGAASYFSKSRTYSLPDMSEKAPLLKLDILPALLVSVREVSAATSNSGVTLVSLVIYHSNVHNENVTITNIALHPGHSRLYADSSVQLGGLLVSESTVNSGKAMPGGETVVNMTKSVRWGYASGTAPSLPLVLKPQEAIATVLQINANEVMLERVFVSPICVRAAVGDGPSTEDIASAHVASDTYRTKSGKNTSVVMVTTDARWTTAPIAVGSTDAFRISLSIREAVCKVGAQVVVSLKVFNLSSDPRDLMLIMAKDPENGNEQNQPVKSRDNLNGMTFTGGNNVRSGASTLGMSGASANNASHHTQQTPAHVQNTVNNAVVYEVSGYTFGCWGLSGDDDGTVRYTRDHDLLAVDAALLLGEVKGQFAVEAELRFVPLREGTLSVPNLKLYDRIEGKWYDCFHTLKIISVAKQ